MTDLIELGDTFVQDPSALYRTLRLQGPACPVLLHGSVRAWLITRHADALALLNDRRLTKIESDVTAPTRARVPYGLKRNPNLLHMDPPRHTRIRKLVVKAFTGSVIDRMKPRIAEIADDLLDEIDRRGADPVEVDLIADYAAPLPIRVITELLGMSADDGNEFRSAVGPLLTMTSDDEKAAAEESVTTLLEGVIRRKRQEPADDLLTALIDASVDGSHLSQPELLSMAFLLITAGYETTVNLIGNGVLALLNHPAQMRLLRGQRSLLSGAIEEMLRYDGPVNTATARYTTCELTVGGVTIPANELVLICPLSANRDGERFPDPDRFDITRDARGHLAFGHGMHFCVGAGLARLEGITAIGHLLDRYDRIALATTEPLVYTSSTLMHGVRSLPVVLERRECTGGIRR